ncbi:MAG: hypothetical protein KatS3mg046_002 [Bellilinea sp.]|nr:MAG: hypothetical protein KatS3mg046_002 [Bellilinea sp.]
MGLESKTPPSPSFQKHRREVIWQIFMPVILAGLMFLGLGLLMVLTPTLGTSRTGHWAAISTIWLISPLILFAVLFLALNIGLIYLMNKILKVLPPYLRVGQVYSQVMVLRVRAFCDRLARPFIRWGGWAAGFRHLRSKVIRR